MPNRSKASRSNQFAPGHRSVTEATIGRLSSMAKQVTRRRRLCSTESSCTTAAKRRCGIGVISVDSGCATCRLGRSPYLKRPGPPSLDAAAEPFGGHFGVPLVAAVAEIVDAAQVDQHLEDEFVAQRAAAVVPGVGREHDATLRSEEHTSELQSLM